MRAVVKRAFPFARTPYAWQAEIGPCAHQVNHSSTASAIEIQSKKLMSLREQVSRCRIKWIALALLLMLFHNTLAAGCFGLGCFGGKQKGHERDGESHEGNLETSEGSWGDASETEEGVFDGMRLSKQCRRMKIRFMQPTLLPDFFRFDCDRLCQHGGDDLQTRLYTSELYQQPPGRAQCNFGYACLLYVSNSIDVQNVSNIASTSYSKPEHEYYYESEHEYEHKPKPEPMKKPASPKRNEDLDGLFADWTNYIREQVGFATVDWWPGKLRDTPTYLEQSQGWQTFKQIFAQAYSRIYQSLRSDDDNAEFRQLKPIAVCHCRYELQFERVVMDDEENCDAGRIINMLSGMLEGYSLVSSTDAPYPFDPDSQPEVCNVHLTTWPNCVCEAAGYSLLRCWPPPYDQYLNIGPR